MCLESVFKAFHEYILGIFRKLSFSSLRYSADFRRSRLVFISFPSVIGKFILIFLKINFKFFSIKIEAEVYRFRDSRSTTWLYLRMYSSIIILYNIYY